ncbi:MULTISPECIES: hypothetical protein [Cyanophyceae]|uniref:hypothetical protein n=1 Tax=Cyanophyceae TaxID=3028117 RepID=UPI001686C8F2|nr:MULTISPECIES: hypothetical protein [Cyanophyceae]MBD1914300.1 hypothetical protein [Phormidium sp. FACHB-77]MBD2031234.1 hypothetical protein [Phormidium sp. FACHB-322]MBD2049634.1 hypothetical protein [Leptolyngbya sp. FACHB-60]
MYFPSEHSLQNFLFVFFKAHGYEAATEVQVGGGKADLVTHIHLIECKQLLTRSKLFEAAGQLTTYLKARPDKLLVIAGLTPASGEYEAKQAAQRLEDVGYLVWFLDEIADFKSFYKKWYGFY